MSSDDNESDDDDTLPIVILKKQKTQSPSQTRDRTDTTRIQQVCSFHLNVEAHPQLDPKRI